MKEARIKGEILNEEITIDKLLHVNVIRVINEE